MRRGGPVASLSMRSGQDVVYRVNKFRIQKDIFSGYATFWYPDGKVGSYLFCKVSVVTRSWELTPHHAKLCEPVGKWPAAILTGPWIRHTESGSRRYILNWTQFHDSAVIARCSLLTRCSEVFWVTALFLNWLWFNGSRFQNGGFVRKFPKMKTVLLAIST